MIGYKMTREILKDGWSIYRIIKLKTHGKVIKPPMGEGKMRCAAVTTLEVYSVRGRALYGKRLDKRLTGKHVLTPATRLSARTEYRVGCKTWADDLNTDAYTVCGRGIHFFPTLKLALAYNP